MIASRVSLIVPLLLLTAATPEVPDSSPEPEPDGYWPRQSLRPASSTTQIEVSFCETSNPTNCAIEQPPMCGPPSGSAQTAAQGVYLAPDPDYPMST